MKNIGKEETPGTPVNLNEAMERVLSNLFNPPPPPPPEPWYSLDGFMRAVAVVGGWLAYAWYSLRYYAIRFFVFWVVGTLALLIILGILVRR